MEAYQAAEETNEAYLKPHFPQVSYDETTF